MMHRLERVDMVANPVLVHHELPPIHEYQSPFVVDDVPQPVQKVANGGILRRQNAGNCQILVVEPTAFSIRLGIAHARQGLRERDLPSFIE